MDAEATALDVALSGLTDWCKAVARHESVTAALVRAGSDLDALLAQQADAAGDVERFGGWELRHRAEAILRHLSIYQPDQKTGTMSGGERRRVAMARLLISAPDVAILDEPTNHLDIATIEWLESYLVDKFTGALLLITHDRYLLDRIVTRTIEIEDGRIYSYDGGWEEYLTAKAERQAQGQRAESNRRNFLRRELEWLRRQPKARTGKQKARISRAHAAIDIVGPSRERSANLALTAVRSGKTILDARDIVVELAGQRLVNGLTLSLRKGERIGIVGPNGVGKTTLLRALMGHIDIAAGKLTRGKNTKIAYLDQTRAGLDPDATVFDCVAEGRGEISLGDQRMDVRTYLKRFLFEVPMQEQKVGTLSGGERARVALARVLREDANVVVLDEPTNDLDVAMLGSLEDSLLSFGGTVLVVTHDRWFLDRVATSILGFEGDGRVVQVYGNYADYTAWREKDQADSKRDEGEAPTSARERVKRPKQVRRGLSFREKRELEGMMDRIAAAELEVTTLEVLIGSASYVAMDYKQQAELADKLAAGKELAEQLVERWSELEAKNEPA